MGIIKLCITLLLLINSFTTILKAEQKITKQDYKHEIRPYIEFLQKGHLNPIDYIFGLFKHHDIVILCERDHRELTQYELIYSIISDPRFINHIGHLFTELGTQSLNDYLKDSLWKDGLNEDEIEDHVKYIYRNFVSHAFWGKYNFYDFLKKIYLLNSKLPGYKRINFYFTDIPFEWKEMTIKKYKEFWKKINLRDQIMADFIFKKFNQIQKSNEGRKKALVIMNFRHAFNDFKFADGKKGDNCGRYLFERFPGKIANVLIHAMTDISKTDEVTISPVQDGKWDAAFEVRDNPNFGFNFTGSPFGEDYFDYFLYRKHYLTYKNVFTGYIFYKPLREHKLVLGIPGLFDDKFSEEVLRRLLIVGNIKDRDTAKKMIRTYNRKKTFPHPKMESHLKKINQWLKDS